MAKKSNAQRARELAAKGMPVPAIAQELGTSRQAVHDAVKRFEGAPRGRPAREGVTRTTIALDEQLLAKLKARAEADGITLGEWIEKACAAALSRKS